MTPQTMRELEIDIKLMRRILGMVDRGEIAYTKEERHSLANTIQRLEMLVYNAVMEKRNGKRNN